MDNIQIVIRSIMEIFKTIRAKVTTGKSILAEETVYEAEATETLQNQGDDMGTTNEQHNVEAASENDWFKKPKRPPTPDPELYGVSVDTAYPMYWIWRIGVSWSRDHARIRRIFLDG
ncbi:hypothetical protein Tco_1084662 [Tanacetum coccineum]